MKSVLASFSILAIAFLSSCGSLMDAGYQQLQATAEINPDPKAIVGMWHRKSGDGMLGWTSNSLLFKSDGSGYFDGYGKTLSVFEGEGRTPFQWWYEGQGVWSFDLYPQSARPRLRLAGKHLLQEVSGELGPTGMVFNKVE